jgi:exosortase
MGLTETTNTWTPPRVLLAILVAGFCVAIASESWLDLLGMAWHDEESSQVFLVPLAIVWLCWVRRDRFSLCTPGGRLLGATLLGAGWLFWSLGYRYQIESFWHGGAVLMAAGGLLSVLGKDVFFKFLPAFAVLIFLVPIPGTGRMVLAVPLQRLTANITQHVAETLGMAVERRGNLLNVNGTDVAVVEACNGMRMVFTLLFSCYVFAFVTPLHSYVRFFILAASPVVAVACNVLRLVPTIWMFGHASTSAANAFHEFAGWAMLIIAFGALLSVVRLLKWAMLPVALIPQTIPRNS